MKKHYTPELWHAHHIILHLIRALARGLLRPAIIGLVFLSFSTILIFAALFYHFEFGVNPSIQSYFDAMYLTVATITTTGFGDISPHTMPGKVLSMAVMLLGTAIFVSFTAVLSTSLIEMDLELAEFLTKRKDSGE